MIGALVALAAIAAPAPQQAGKLYSDDMARCLVEKSSEADRALLVQWVFAAISVSPAVKEMTSITPAQRDEYHRSAGALFERLVTRDCRDKTVLALRYNGAASIESSFGVLGEVAMRDLTNQPLVNAEFVKMATNVDEKALVELFREAGASVE